MACLGADDMVRRIYLHGFFLAGEEGVNVVEL